MVTIKKWSGCDVTFGAPRRPPVGSTSTWNDLVLSSFRPNPIVGRVFSPERTEGPMESKYRPMSKGDRSFSLMS